ncbi:MAG: alpha/beta hydrolase, partial [Longimicrobiales bacterium]
LAGEDRLVDTQRSLTFARSLAAADVTIRVHSDSHHEVLNEPERNVALREIADWIADRIP